MSMVHLSRRHEGPGLAAPALGAGDHRRHGAGHRCPDTKTPWQDYAGDYDRIRDTMAQALDGFEDFNRRVRQPLGFRHRQPARERVFLTRSGRAEFSTAPLPDVVPGRRPPDPRARCARTTSGTRRSTPITTATAA